MDSGQRNMTMRMNDDDRLSSLPNDLLHKILSSFTIKQVIQLAVLSSRWRSLWTSTPHLDLSTKDYQTLPIFSKYVTNVLSRRDNLTDLHSLNLTFRGKTSQPFVKRILNYAFSHNIQQLNVVYLVTETDHAAEFPLALFGSSRSLKHLSLTMQNGSIYHTSSFGNSMHGSKETRPYDFPYDNNNNNNRDYASVTLRLTLASTPDLPTLTTLDLHSVTFGEDTPDVGVFAKCANLKNLTLKDCKVNGPVERFDICHPRLSNLTLENSFDKAKVVKVAAPQLENLSIKVCYPKLMVSAPELASFVFKGSCPLYLVTHDGFHSLKKADICTSGPLPRHKEAPYAYYRAQHYKKASIIVSLLKKLHSVHFLTLNLEIVELLSLQVEHLVHLPSPFVNLKTLKIYPITDIDLVQEPFVTMPAEVKSYLLDGSSKSTFTMVLREEIRAQEIMAKLKELLAKEKDNTNSNDAHLERGKAQMGQSHIPNQLIIGGNMATNIKSYQENLGVQVQGRREKATYIITLLLHMEEILTRLPASKRAEIKPRFDSLCAEASIAVSKLTDYIKIRCDEKQR